MRVLLQENGHALSSLAEEKDTQSACLAECGDCIAAECMHSLFDVLNVLSWMVTVPEVEAFDLDESLGRASAHQQTEKSSHVGRTTQSHEHGIWRQFACMIQH